MRSVVFLLAIVAAISASCTHAPMHTLPAQTPDPRDTVDGATTLLGKWRLVMSQKKNRGDTSFPDTKTHNYIVFNADSSMIQIREDTSQIDTAYATYSTHPIATTYDNCTNSLATSNVTVVFCYKVTKDTLMMREYTSGYYTFWYERK